MSVCLCMSVCVCVCVCVCTTCITKAEYEPLDVASLDKGIDIAAERHLAAVLVDSGLRARDGIPFTAHESRHKRRGEREPSDVFACRPHCKCFLS